MANSNEAVLVPDDDLTASEPESVASRKRKRDPNFHGKIEWTEDEDEAEDVLPKPKRKTAAKRGRPGKLESGSRHNRLEEEEQEKEKEKEKDIASSDKNVDIAPHIKTRRHVFQEKHKKLRLGGLLLPPDFSDIYFSDDERMEALEERPQFGGIKASRPYKDIELDLSAGLIPASIAQYLRDYQVRGVQFLHTHFVYQTGAILGDDMGLGKTVQVAAFLTTAFGKTGDERDRKRMRKMRREGGEGRWYPRALIICPGSLIENWRNELDRWGWWIVDLYHGSGSGKEQVLQSAKAGHTEVMITTYGTYKNHRQKINSVAWDVVVADECHCLKGTGSEVTKAMNDVNALCRIGLTGTAIQNRYEELWTLLNWTNPGYFGTLGEWKLSICKPLAIGQSHDATLAQLSLARKTAKKLVQNLLPPFFLRRMKSSHIADQLPKKSDRVVFCPLTDAQRDAYENFLDGENCTIIRGASDPCDCGSGNKSGWCCHAYLPNGEKWQSFVFPAMFTLQKLANHLTLLIPSTVDPTPKQEKELDNLKVCVPEDWEVLFENRDRLTMLSNPEFCGKWKILKKLLKVWHGNGDKVLVFSHSVRMLRIFRHLFQNTSFSVSYLDGSLDYTERQRVVDEFNGDPTQFVFLISTKAGGVGLNITSANKVVIVDPHWNPSYDLQAQDRAYRIGQVRDVDVFRLVSAGTIEEIVYARQIYKQQQANIGYTASSERRYFKGVQQEKGRKGELFGLRNLLTYRSQVVLQNIVNKTNIAEAKAGIMLAEVDMDAAIQEAEEGLMGNVKVKKEDGGNDDDGGMGVLAKILTEGDDKVKKEAEKEGAAGASGEAGRSESRESTIKPRSDAIQAILASAGVEYTHENSEVIGTSKVEEQLSRRAVLTSERSALEGRDGALFEEDEDTSRRDIMQGSEEEGPFGEETRPFRKGRRKSGGGGAKNKYRYNPPDEVMKRQFCTMAKEFGFESAQDFALVVESWTQERRRECLDEFYARERVVEKAETEGDNGLKEELEEEGGAKVKKEGEAVRNIGLLRPKEEIKDHEEGWDFMVKSDDGSDDVEVKQESRAKREPKIKEEPGAEKEEMAGDYEHKSSAIFVVDDDSTDEL
ncbi:DNA excision repair protein [Zalerion maritima]|uniref:DNA excision repair protein n=1 Tax=Zalerion maritima TaxID=339359 RepID=A0AAD5WSM7_9PEZI|nr:DNA excision repair protein [Zalerion maritima]